MNIRIEKIQEHDFEELIALFLEFATFEKASELMINSTDRMMNEKEFVNGFTAKDENNNIVGYVTYFFAYYTWVGKSLYMDDLYVRKEYRGKGIGTLLINEIISLSKVENCNRLRWQVSNWNKPAIDFYKGLGATINETERNCDLKI